MEIHLVPDWFNFGLTLVSTTILLLVLKKFAWAPMQEFLQKRQELVTREMTNAQDLKEEAASLKAAAQSQIDNARDEARKVLEASQKQAEALREEIIATARLEAEQRLAKATVQIEMERKTVYGNIRSDIVELAMASAEKLIEKEINAENHEKLFNSFLEKVGGSHE